MSKFRTANLLGALACEIVGRIERQSKLPPNETNSSIAAITLISFYSGCSNRALSRALGLSHTATVRLVDKLEASGLVISATGTDRRAVALDLTDAGRARAREAVQQRCALVGNMIGILTPTQRAQLDDIAETLLRSMVETADDADHICRLCDGDACPPDHCPVHEKELALDGALPPA